MYRAIVCAFKKNITTLRYFIIFVATKNEIVMLNLSSNFRALLRSHNNFIHIKPKKNNLEKKKNDFLNAPI